MSKTPYPSTTFALLLVACLACGSAVAQQFSAWSAPVNLGPSINTEFSEFHSAISADGLTLFFASDRTGGFGSDGTNDLWVAQRRNRNADWEPAQNLGATPPGGSTPCGAADATPNAAGTRPSESRAKPAGATQAIVIQRDGAKITSTFKGPRQSGTIEGRADS
jgi:WD40-like Beta Propeller Repeat